jgi:cell division protein FtsW (lipid II flippase)
MSAAFGRHLAQLVAQGFLKILPSELEPWGWAIRRELDEIPCERSALHFALSSSFGLLPQAIAIHANAVRRAAFAFFEGEKVTMTRFDHWLQRPRALGTACAVAAVMLGLVHLFLAGAPIRYLAVNAGALILGLAVLAIFGKEAASRSPWPGAGALLMAAILLLIGLFGEQADSARRWLNVGPFFVQPSLFLLPLILFSFAKSRTLLSMLGVVTAAIAMAVQPDRGMAAILMLGILALLAHRTDKFAGMASTSAVLGFVVALVRADTEPAMPFVDQIYYTTFAAHPLAWIALFAGTILLLLPAISGYLQDPEQRERHVLFGLIWLTAIGAAALGNYPTPVVGYSGSAVLGYVLSLLILPKRSGVSLQATPSKVESSGEATSTTNRMHRFTNWPVAMRG